MTLANLRHKVDSMIDAVVQRANASKPWRPGIVWYEAGMTPYDPEMSLDVYHALIEHTQPAVREQIAALAADGIPVAVWLPKKTELDSDDF
jgi:hypothetical protein